MIREEIRGVIPSLASIAAAFGGGTKNDVNGKTDQPGTREVDLSSILADYGIVLRQTNSE